MSPDTHAALEAVYEYCRARDWMGYDPYDGLNSRAFNAMPFRSNRIARLVQTQVFKRSPVNLRPIAQVEVSHNPKGLGLFLSATSGLHLMHPEPRYHSEAHRLADLLDGARSEGCSGACWGYNFPWEARAFSQPRYAPTVVATVFSANAFMDAWETFNEPRFLAIARSACDFVLNDLTRMGTPDCFCFSYSPRDDAQVYNASMLAAQLLSRVFAATGERDLASVAEGAVRFVVEHQEDDGSWFYGTQGYQQWTDSFHTGYIVVGLADYIAHTGDTTFAPALEAGYQHYAKAFFGAAGEPLRLPGRPYPFDTHNAAQGIITFVRMGALDRAKAVAGWTIDNMLDPSGYFYYRKGRFTTSRIPYMRWCQAFMTLALVRLEGAMP